MIILEKKEIGVFIIWENARKYEDEILARIKQNFRILKKFEMEWDRDLFSANLTSFYEMNLRIDCDNLRVRGTGIFLAVVVEDCNPIYSIQRTNRGIENVNTNMYLFKQKIRDEITHNYSFHASISYEECKNNIVKLFGLNVEDFFKQYKLDGKTEKLIRNCPGVNGWSSAREFFYVLNECMPYVLLRGFENIPYEYSFKNDGDIDILVNDLPRFRNLLAPNGETNWNAFLFFNYVELGNENTLIHPKFVGDYYYDNNWEKEILRTRVFEGGRYIPNNENYYWTLLYHGLFHKENYKKYEDIFRSLSEIINADYIDDNEYLIGSLSDYMLEKDYKVQLHLDNKAGHLCMDNIPLHLLGNETVFYIFKSFYKDQIVGITVVSKRLIYMNSSLFTDIVQSYDKWLYLDNSILNAESPLYAYVSKREKECGEYLWKFSKRYDDISVMSYFDDAKKREFKKSFWSNRLSIGSDVIYLTESSDYVESGIKVVDYYATCFIKGGRGELLKAIKNFLHQLFIKYSADASSLRGEAWDLCSKNCFVREDQYIFFDMEARYKKNIEKSFMVAVEVDLVKREGIYEGSENDLFDDLCKELSLHPKKGYDEYIAEKYMCVDKIILGELEFPSEIMFTAYNVPVASDMIPKIQHEKLHESIRVYDRNVQSELSGLRKSHRLVEDMLEIEFSTFGYDMFFKKHNIKSIIVYGLGKYGIRFLNSRKHEEVNIIGCIDREKKEFRDYHVFCPGDEIPNNDAIIVALLDGEELVKQYKNDGVKCLLLRDIVDEILYGEEKVI